ncbi:MAG: hypothetical protein O7B35_08910 [Deltaproteobacteria bacterium]|nr:hypothetical protein [Deltaproteobacteria bacterium]
MACEALMGTRNLTITSARLLAATETTPQYCYVKGILSPAIVYHVQPPLPQDWNSRFLKPLEGVGSHPHRPFNSHLTLGPNLSHFR